MAANMKKLKAVIMKKKKDFLPCNLGQFYSKDCFVVFLNFKNSFARFFKNLSYGDTVVISFVELFCFLFVCFLIFYLTNDVKCSQLLFELKTNLV